MERKRLIQISLLLLPLWLCGCAETTTNPIGEGEAQTLDQFVASYLPSPSTTADSVQHDAVYSNYLNFSVSDFQSRNKPAENQIHAPFDSYLLLASLALGAQSSTLDAFITATQSSQLETTTFEQISHFSSETEAIRGIDVGRYLWGQSHYLFNTAYLQSVADLFHPELSEQNFLQDTFSSSLAIDGVLSSSLTLPLRAQTRLALGHRTELTARIDPSISPQLTTARFANTAGQQVLVDMTLVQGSLNSYQGENYRAVAIPFEDTTLSMMLIMPEASAFTSVQQGLTSIWWRQLLQSLSPTSTSVYIPHVSIQHKILPQNWIDLGIAEVEPDASTPGFGADFSIINNQGYLYLSPPQQEISFDIGFEQLSVSTISSAVLQASIDEPPLLFEDINFNFSVINNGALFISTGEIKTPCFDSPDQKPFLFVLYASESGMPVHIGQVVSMEGATVEPDWITSGSCATPNIQIYQYKGSVQCDSSSGTPLAQMQSTLETAGIEVLDAYQDNDNLIRIQMQLCGSPDSVINVFSIHERNWPQAQSLGFQRLTGFF